MAARRGPSCSRTALTQQDFYDNRYLSLVNVDNLLASAYEPEVSKISVTRYQMFSTEFMPNLDAFIQAIQDAGFSVWVNAAYRTYSYQNHLFNSKASQIAYEKVFAEEGVRRTVNYEEPVYQEAVEETKKIVMYPGSSEHQLGLAVDLMDKSYGKLVYDEMNQDFYKFLDEHCAEYGFIKRYPTRKLLLTGWDEPWHYRYVGPEYAEDIYNSGLTLEEYLEIHYGPINKAE